MKRKHTYIRTFFSYHCVSRPSVALSGLVPVVCPAIISIALNTASMSTLRTSSLLTAMPTMLPVGISINVYNQLIYVR